MTIYVDEIEAGRKAARVILTRHGLSSFVSDEQVDEAVHAVLTAVEEVRASRSKQE